MDTRATWTTIALISLCALAAAPGAPDIAPEPVGREGTTLAAGGTTRIAMVAESVLVTLYGDHAHVDATFLMRNTGDADETLQVGFPGAARPTGYLVQDGKVTVTSWGPNLIQGLVATVDAEPIEAKPVQRSDDARSDAHIWWLCWDLAVPAGGESTVCVRYDVATADAEYLPPSRLQTRELIYVLKTGAGWHGPIGSAHVVVRGSAGLGLDHVDVLQPVPTKRDADSIVWMLTDFEPDEDVLVRYRLYADAEDAVRRTAEELANDGRAADLGLLLDHAENLEALGRFADAAAAYERLRAAEAAWGFYYRRPQTDYIPYDYRAAWCWRRAGRVEDAARAASNAIASLRGLLEELDDPQRFGSRKVLHQRRAAFEGYVEELSGW